MKMSISCLGVYTPTGFCVLDCTIKKEMPFKVKMHGNQKQESDVLQMDLFHTSNLNESRIMLVNYCANNFL